MTDVYSDVNEIITFTQYQIDDFIKAIHYPIFYSCTFNIREVEQTWLYSSIRHPTPLPFFAPLFLPSSIIFPSIPLLSLHPT